MPPEIEHVAVAHSFHRTLIVSAGAPSATPSQDVRFRSKAFALHTPSQFTRQLLTSRLRGRDLKSEEAALLFQVLVAEVRDVTRSEEHTSELQSPDHLVCRLLLEKKNTVHCRSYTATVLYSCSQSDLAAQRL